MRKGQCRHGYFNYTVYSTVCGFKYALHIHKNWGESNILKPLQFGCPSSFFYHRYMAASVLIFSHYIQHFYCINHHLIELSHATESMAAIQGTSCWC